MTKKSKRIMKALALAENERSELFKEYRELESEAKDAKEIDTVNRWFSDERKRINDKLASRICGR